MNCCSGDVNTLDSSIVCIYTPACEIWPANRPTQKKPEIYLKTHKLTTSTLLYFVASQLDSCQSALLLQWESVIIAILPVFPRSWFNFNPAEWSRRSAAAARARASLLVTPSARPQTFTAHARRMRGSSLSFWGDTMNSSFTDANVIQSVRTDIIILCN